MREVSDKSGIPTGRGGERHWEDSAEAVDDVGAEEQRYMEARIVNSSVLEMVGKALPDRVEHGAEFTLLREGVAVDSARAGRVDIESGGRGPGEFCGVRFRGVVLDQLADLLVECHSLEQRVDLLLNFRAGDLRVGSCVVGCLRES